MAPLVVRIRPFKSRLEIVRVPGSATKQWNCPDEADGSSSAPRDGVYVDDFPRAFGAKLGAVAFDGVNPSSAKIDLACSTSRMLTGPIHYYLCRHPP